MFCSRSGAFAAAAAATVGCGSVMALETLSPDWEFDRVDDGSQSKRWGGEGLQWEPRL